MKRLTKLMFGLIACTTLAFGFSACKDKNEKDNSKNSSSTYSSTSEKEETHTQHVWDEGTVVLEV